jgi:hypothetical protein
MKVKCNSADSLCPECSHAHPHHPHFIKWDGSDICNLEGQCRKKGIMVKCEPAMDYRAPAEQGGSHE